MMKHTTLCLVVLLIAVAMACFTTASHPILNEFQQMLKDTADYRFDPSTLLEDDVPYPFLREFAYNSQTYVEGKDVFILQHLLNRWDQKPNIAITGKYDSKTSTAVKNYKAARGITPADAKFDKATATQVVADFLLDNYKDNGIKAADLGLKFKVYIPVYQNRSIETTATLFDANNNVLHKFRARTRAHTVYGDEPWPAFDDATSGLNELTGWGQTPSGLHLIDINTPEPESVKHLYGKWNVLRSVRGLEGNAEIAIPYIRNGILMHTGEWAEHSDWTPEKNMPNSSGCVHIHPADQEIVTKHLTAMGLPAHVNPFGQLPYPYPVQGLLSVEVVPDSVKLD